MTLKEMKRLGNRIIDLYLFVTGQKKGKLSYAKWKEKLVEEYIKEDDDSPFAKILKGEK